MSSDIISSLLQLLSQGQPTGNGLTPPLQTPMDISSLLGQTPAPIGGGDVPLVNSTPPMDYAPVPALSQIPVPQGMPAAPSQENLRQPKWTSRHPKITSGLQAISDALAAYATLNPAYGPQQRQRMAIEQQNMALEQEREQRAREMFGLEKQREQRLQKTSDIQTQYEQALAEEVKAKTLINKANTERKQKALDQLYQIKSGTLSLDEADGYTRSIVQAVGVDDAILGFTDKDMFNAVREEKKFKAQQQFELMKELNKVGSPFNAAYNAWLREHPGQQPTSKDVSEINKSVKEKPMSITMEAPGTTKTFYDTTTGEPRTVIFTPKMALSPQGMVDLVTKKPLTSEELAHLTEKEIKIPQNEKSSVTYAKTSLDQVTRARQIVSKYPQLATLLQGTWTKEGLKFNMQPSTDPAVANAGAQLANHLNNLWITEVRGMLPGRTPIQVMDMFKNVSPQLGQPATTFNGFMDALEWNAKNRLREIADQYGYEPFDPETGQSRISSRQQGPGGTVQPIIQRNKKTGAMRISKDGGLTWQILPSK